MRTQVLTKPKKRNARDCVSEQGLGFKPPRTAPIDAHSYVKQHAYCEHASTEVDRAARRPTRPALAAKKKGGWQSTAYIGHADYRRHLADAGTLSHAGYPLNVMATVRSPLDPASDTVAKRHIELQFARLGQALERKGHGYIALKVFEKPCGGQLHGHLLLHVRQECFGAIEAWADRFDRQKTRPYSREDGVHKHARNADARAIRYVLKQHKFAGPYERQRLFYEKSDPIVGRRVAFTKMAAAFIRRAAQPRPADGGPAR